MAAPFDDPKIIDADVLIRRVNPRQHVVPDANTGRKRISSMLYKPSSKPDGGMSVDVLGLVECGEDDARRFVTTPTFTGAVQFLVADARQAGLRVGADPVPNNPYHAEVWGSAPRANRFTRAQEKALRAAASWFVALPDVDL